VRFVAEQGADFVIVHEVDRLARNRYDDVQRSKQRHTRCRRGFRDTFHRREARAAAP
jgi:hypothetical protein